MPMPKWNDVFSPEELASALDVYAAKLAREKGWYEISGDIRHAASCIRDLSEAGQKLANDVRSSIESLQ